MIVWSAFTTAAGQPVAAGNLTVTLGSSGQFNASLAPNSGATPAGTYYRVTYKLDDGSTASEYWSVPNLATTTIGAIRSTLVPANQAVQFLTREYADSHYLDFTDAQTVTGVKTFANSPSVPTPQNSTDAANKAYVDASGGGGNLSSPPPIGNDLLGVIAHHDMQFVLARLEIIKQPLRVKRAAGSGDGNENFHCTDYDQVAQNGQLIPLVLEFRGSITSTRTTTGRIELETA